jgi:hypothetical protein
MHIAEVIQMAMHEAAQPSRRYVEMGWIQEEPSYPLVTAAATGLLVAGGLALFGRIRDGTRGPAQDAKTPINADQLARHQTSNLR